jgi:hypothetical protein
MKTNHKNHLDLPSDFSLESLRDQNPFRVPDGYFDELPQRISARIEANPIRTKTRRLHPGVFAAAASVVLLLGLTVVMRTSIFNPSTESISNYSATELSSIPDTHIVNHLDKAITSGEIDESALMDVVATATAQEATSNTTTAEVQSEATGILPNVSDEDIINYLIQNQTPTSTTNDILKNDLN